MAAASTFFTLKKTRVRTGLLGRVSEKLGWWIAQGLMWVYFVTVVFPILWTVFTSFKTSREIFNSPWALPVELQFTNYMTAWTRMNAGIYTFNSIIVTSATLICVMLLGSMISYALARYDFPGNRFLYFLFLSGMMVPGFLSYIPAWFLHRSLGTLNTYWVLIIQYTANSLPFTIFFLHSFFKTLPRELEEAAIVDGASLFTVFWKVMLPLSRSGLVTVGVFNFLGIWNEFFWALITISDNRLKTLPLGTVNILQQAKYATDWGAMFAGFVIILIPTLIVYVVFQSRLTEGITIGAIKG